LDIHPKDERLEKRNSLIFFLSTLISQRSTCFPSSSGKSLTGPRTFTGIRQTESLLQASFRPQ
jgi:hypothetical protein